MFSLYPQFEYPLAAAQLILAMSGMGATLTLTQFKAILWRPHPIILVLVLQYLVLPGLAALVARLAGVPPGIAVGMVLINSVPSGSFTNVFTYLGHGNVTLSIVMTVASTIVCFVLTPLAIDLFTTAELPPDFRIPLDKTLPPVVYFLVLPLIAGMLMARFFPRGKHAFAKWAVRASLVPLALIVVGSLGSGRIDVFEYGLGIPLLLIAFVFATYGITRLLTKWIRYNTSDSFTMAIEVMVRNGNLAIALVASLFPATEKDDPTGRGVFFVTLFYAGATMVVALIAVVRRRMKLWRTRQVESLGSRDESQNDSGPRPSTLDPGPDPSS